MYSRSELEKIVYDVIKYETDTPEFNKAVDEINAIQDEKIKQLVLDAIFDYRDKIKPQH